MRETFHLPGEGGVEEVAIEPYLGELGISWERAKQDVLPKLAQMIETVQEYGTLGLANRGLQYDFGTLCEVPCHERGDLIAYRQAILNELYVTYGAQLECANIFFVEHIDFGILEQRVVVPAVAGVLFVEQSHLDIETLEPIFQKLEIWPIEAAIE
jgi:hypothetical protein